MSCLENIRPDKIISGGQTGADQAGLYAGELLKIKTGGTAPYNFMTDEGIQIQLLTKFGLIPGPFDTKIYPKRTELNVKNSDGTILFGRLDRPGTKLTIKYCKKYQKLYFENPTSLELKFWIQLHNIHILNVAGNRERTNPGIFMRVVDIIVEAFK
jgi:hypothetical protein